MSAAAPVLTLDESLVAFLGGGVSIVVASRDAANRPSVAPAAGCRVAADRRAVTVFVAASQAGTLVDDVRASQVVAAVFTRPTTHRTYQLKGPPTAIGPLAPGDRERIAAHADRLVGELAELGEPEAFVRALFDCAPDDVVAITFAPTSAFDQTPGPRAGAPLPA